MPKPANKSVIAIDIDDVLASSAGDFVKFSNKIWGTNLGIDDYDEHWARMWKVDDHEAIHRAGIVFKSKVPSKYSHITDAKPVLKKLSKDYKLVVATSRSKPLQDMTLSWIEEKFAGIFSDIHFSGVWDRGADLDTMAKLTKAELCEQIGADYLIDDQLKHCIAVGDAGIKALLFGDYNWNKTNALPKNVTRVKNWQEVLEYFDGQG